MTESEAHAHRGGYSRQAVRTLANIEDFEGATRQEDVRGPSELTRACSEDETNRELQGIFNAEQRRQGAGKIGKEPGAEIFHWPTGGRPCTEPEA
jgi:hypothetical protein